MSTYENDPCAIAQTNDPSRAFVGIVGQALTLGLLNNWATPTAAVVSQPAGATAAFSGLAITPDKPGIWTFTVSLASRSITYKLVVFPAEALTATAITKRKDGSPRSLDDQLGILRSLALNVSASLLNGLSSAQPLPPVALQPFGGDYGQ